MTSLCVPKIKLRVQLWDAEGNWTGVVSEHPAGGHAVACTDGVYRWSQTLIASRQPGPIPHIFWEPTQTLHALEDNAPKEWQQWKLGSTAVRSKGYSGTVGLTLLVVAQTAQERQTKPGTEASPSQLMPCHKPEAHMDLSSCSVATLWCKDAWNPNLPLMVVMVTEETGSLSLHLTRPTPFISRPTTYKDDSCKCTLRKDMTPIHINSGSHIKKIWVQRDW